MYHPRLMGNHYDIGRHYGELLAKSGIDLSPVLAIPEQQTAFGLSCLPIYEQYLPKIMQEVRGLADGLGQHYEVVACWLFALYCFESDHGCSVFSVRWCEKYAAATNHFITPAMQQYNAEDENWYQTRDRLATLEAVLANGNMTFEECKELLSGKRGFLCQYEKKLHFETIWSAVYDLNSLSHEICEGNPAKSAFRSDTRLAWVMNKAKRK